MGSLLLVFPLLVTHVASIGAVKYRNELIINVIYIAELAQVPKSFLIAK
jgi:hypothetical protein